jgi:hypothetical protein
MVPTGRAVSRSPGNLGYPEQRRVPRGCTESAQVGRGLPAPHPAAGIYLMLAGSGLPGTHGTIT